MIRISRMTVLYSILIHAALLALGLIVPSGSAEEVSFGGDAIYVDVVTIDTGAALPNATDEVETVQEEQEDLIQDDPVEQEEDLQEAVVDVDDQQDEVLEETVTVQEEEEDADSAEEVEEEEDSTQDEASGGYSAITGEGESGGGAPGPASYEGRVFAAIRRNFRTSVDPLQSYRIRFTVYPDGTTEVEVLRTSGVETFDRAVESAIRLASVPPFPYGRTDPVTLSIEFLGPP